MISSTQMAVILLMLKNSRLPWELLVLRPRRKKSKEWCKRLTAMIPVLLNSQNSLIWWHRRWLSGIHARKCLKLSGYLMTMRREKFLSKILRGWQRNWERIWPMKKYKKWSMKQTETVIEKSAKMNLIGSWKRPICSEFIISYIG